MISGGNRWCWYKFTGCTHSAIVTQWPLICQYLGRLLRVVLLNDQASRCVGNILLAALARQIIVDSEPRYLALSTNVAIHVAFRFRHPIECPDIDPNLIWKRQITHNDRRAAAPAKTTLTDVRGFVDNRFTACNSECLGGESNESGKPVAIGFLTIAAMTVPAVLFCGRFFGLVSDGTAKAPARPNLGLFCHECALRMSRTQLEKPVC